MVGEYKVLHLGVKNWTELDLRTLLSNTRFTLDSKGGALPMSVVVIPDTNMYPATAQSIIVNIYRMKGEDKD
jgi:hypothetical protein